MDFFVARAMQIAALNTPHIHALHAKEKAINRCLFNHEVQAAMGFQTLDDWFRVPEDGQAQHAQRIRAELVNKSIAAAIEHRETREGVTDTFVSRPWEAVTSTNVDVTHAFDWRVHEAIAAGEISFAYAGGSGKKGGSLADRVIGGKKPERLQEATQ